MRFFKDILARDEQPEPPVGLDPDAFDGLELPAAGAAPETSGEEGLDDWLEDDDDEDEAADAPETALGDADFSTRLMSEIDEEVLRKAEQGEADRLGRSSEEDDSFDDEDPDVAAAEEEPPAENGRVESMPIWDLMKEPGDETEADPAFEIEQLAEPDRVTTRELAADEPEPGSDGRAKTRLLGFHQAEDAEPDVFERGGTAAAAEDGRFPVGWLAVIEGPGRGHFFTLFNGVATVGRGADQAVRLDFGDAAISRDNHVAIAYDEECNGFYIGHGGKTNLARLNGTPILSTQELAHGDIIRIGETTLRFVAFCVAEFAWDLTDEDAEPGLA